MFEQNDYALIAHIDNFKDQILISFIYLYAMYAIVPGDPQDVKAVPLNSTSIHVAWMPPVEKDRNGIIRGYHIHVQETREEV